jgi:hypothetical protein
MTLEQNAKLHALEAEIARLANANATSVLLALLSSLVETVCSVHGSTFVVIYKIKFYERVLRTLQEKGIS